MSFAAAPTPVYSSAAKPKGRLETLPVDQLTFDARLQRRAFPAGQLVSPEVVGWYAVAMKDGVEFPPLDAVFDGTRYWVIGGFHRGRAAKDAGRHSVAVVVCDGTFDDARLWSLAQNATHGQARRPQDIQKAFDALMDDEKLLARVMIRVKDDGGLYRTLAKAIGCTQSIMQKYLRRRGLRANRHGRLVPIEASMSPPAAADTDASPARASDPEPESEYVPTPEPDLPGVPAAVRSAIARRPQQDALMKAVAAIAREFAAAAVGPGGEYLRDVHYGGVRLVREVRRKGRGKVTTEWECPLLLALARAVGSARVQPRACAGCGGDGCRCCAELGHLPESLDYLTDITALAAEIASGVAKRPD